MIENEYGIKTKPASPGKPQADAIVEIIHQVLGNTVLTYNLQETYVYDIDPWMGILASASFAVRSTYHRTKGKIPGQIVFWLRYYPPYKSRSGLEMCTSAQTDANR